MTADCWSLLMDLGSFDFYDFNPVVVGSSLVLLGQVNINWPVKISRYLEPQELCFMILVCSEWIEELSITRTTTLTHNTTVLWTLDWGMLKEHQVPGTTGKRAQIMSCLMRSKGRSKDWESRLLYAYSMCA